MFSKKAPMELKKFAMAPKKPPSLLGSSSWGGSVGVLGSVGSVGSVGGTVGGSVGGTVGSGSPVAGARTCPQTVQT